MQDRVKSLVVQGLVHSYITLTAAGLRAEKGGKEEGNVRSMSSVKRRDAS